MIMVNNSIAMAFIVMMKNINYYCYHRYKEIIIAFVIISSSCRVKIYVFMYAVLGMDIWQERRQYR